MQCTNTILNTTHNCLIKKPTKKYKTTEYSQTGRVPSTAAVLPRWMAMAALCINHCKNKFVILTTEWLLWLQSSCGYEIFTVVFIQAGNSLTDVSGHYQHEG